MDQIKRNCPLVMLLPFLMMGRENGGLYAPLTGDWGVVATEAVAVTARHPVGDSGKPQMAICPLSPQLCHCEYLGTFPAIVLENGLNIKRT